jgi:hypothetical protein
MSKERLLVIGGDAAGMSAASQARRPAACQRGLTTAPKINF